MIVQISRTGRHGKEPEDAPIEGAYLENRLVTMHCTCKTIKEAMKHAWFARQMNPRVTDTGTAVDIMSAVWLLDIPDIQSIESLLYRFGHHFVVMQSDVVGIALKLEIYDGYRE